MTDRQIKTMIFTMRPDLQEAHPNIGSESFELWWSETGARHYGLDETGSARKNPPWASLDVTLVGYHRAEMGLGDHIRVAARALKSAGGSVNVVNIGEGVAQRQNDDSGAHFESDELAPIVIVCVAFDQLPRLFQRFSPEALAERHVIAFSAWELSQLPRNLLPTLWMVDEVWTISHFMKQAMLPVSSVGVYAMPIAVETPEFPPARREEFGLAEDECVFLTVFDSGSFLARKNPHSVVRAFQEAFGEGSERRVRLVMKTHSAWNAQPGWEELVELASDPRITLINESWTKERLHQLMAVADCFVSLHRAEGFGRGPAEAMLLGKPVIVTAYSGVMEYCNADNCLPVDYTLVPVKEGEYPHHEWQAWAEPNQSQAAELMRRVVNGDAEVGRTVQRGLDSVRTVLDLKKLGARYLERIRQIQAVSMPK